MCLLFANIALKAQQKDSIHTADTLGFVAKMKKKGDDEAKRSIQLYKTDRLKIKQNELLAEEIATNRKAKAYLKIGIDTIAIDAEIKKIDGWYNIAADGVFTNKGTAQTYRNLKATSKIISELLNRVNNRKKQVDKYVKDLEGFGYHLDSLYSDTSIYTFSSDSATLSKYIKRLRIIVDEIGPTEKALEQAIPTAQLLQSNINILVNKLNASLEEIEQLQVQLSGKTFQREFANLGDPVGFSRPFSEILRFSSAKTALSLLFYMQGNAGKILLVIILTIAAAFFIKALKQRVVEDNLLQADYTNQLVLRYPALSAIIITLSLGQFIFVDPPFIFACLFWILSAVCLTIIVKKIITTHWMHMWVVMLLLFMVCCSGNLVLQASRAERWGMLVLALAGVFTGLFFLTKGNRAELREKLILWFIGLMVIMETASAIANIFGRFNLSKTLLTSGYLNVITGILFLWVVRLINEGLSLSSDIYKIPERKLFYINFDRVGKKAPALFYILLIVGWFFLVGRNFYAFKFVLLPLNMFLFTDRTIGDFTFSISSVLIFFLIVSLSIITSKIVSFFASDKHLHTPTGKEKKTGIGSWLLLIRVSIITLGMLLALAASGFPMDRITIIIGALGLGIGLGLQTLVNNLVSGLIIAFEKPVNVGDTVEIAGQSGIMKSIGFRSSVITTSDGADVVMPNGDLLSAHLVNWTLGGGKRRMNIVLGVAYGTSLDKAKNLLSNVITAEERILKYPAPQVLFDGFGDSAINIKILFWVRQLQDVQATKSDLITAIDNVFKQNGITIPFPQSDVHVYNTNGKQGED